MREIKFRAWGVKTFNEGFHAAYEEAKARVESGLTSEELEECEAEQGDVPSIYDQERWLRDRLLNGKYEFKQERRPTMLYDIAVGPNFGIHGFERIALMQFTGLHDKNGKEIYEGDVVEFMWSGKLRREAVEWNTTDCGFMYVRLNPLSNEIIGNIYENPDLLK